MEQLTDSTVFDRWKTVSPSGTLRALAGCFNFPATRSRRDAVLSGREGGWSWP
jgi:hypothetical protein